MGTNSRDDFEVAIICALPREADAVLRLFDQNYDEHGVRYSKQEGDMNAYSTGRIGQHNIVLAHMPRIGPTSAANVATGLRLSFRKVRLALVVGVCGAAPLERPIILGDVIISDSVVEFDFGRQYPNHFKRKSGPKDTLGRPNTEIGALLNKLETLSVRQRMEGTILQNLARLQEKVHTASYPGAEYDRLFVATCRHVHRQDTPSHGCWTCANAQLTNDPICDEALESDCDALGCNGLVVLENSARGARLASENPAPLVHIGTIGSANMVMKSGEHRDAIARENNIIAFEMEGAGVWDNLPCIVIKGVCDYADSHKNKKWQDYAAATAASAAKAFLDYWTPSQHNIISGSSSRKRRLSCNSEHDLSASNGARRMPRPDRQNTVVSALPLTDHTSTGSQPPSTSVNPDVRKIRLDALAFEQLDARHDTIKNAHAATCEWLLSKSEYLDWQSEDKVPEHHGFLWIKGKPGAGKSTIMKFAYTNAKKKVGGPVVISYFFNARGESLEKSTIGMYQSLLFQLLSDIPRLQEVLDSREAVNLQAVSPDSWTVESLQLLFRQAIEKLDDRHLTCYVDALDECENNVDHVREMVRFFEDLGECALRDNIRFLVCFSSRHYPHITIHKSIELVLEVEAGHSEDITKYIRSRLRIGSGKRVDQVKIDVQNKSQGIFLWVVLVVPILQKAFDDGLVHALGKCLKDIPDDLDKLFQDILTRDTENMDNLKLCLRWILYAERPLSPEELYFAVLSTSSSSPATAWDPEDLKIEYIKRFILSSSKGLAEATKSKTPTIQFIHESVRDFLLKESGSALQADIGLASAALVHDFLKHSCQRYLVSIPSSLISIPSSLTGRVRNPMETTRQMSRDNEAKFPFLRYSACYVFKHADSAASLGMPQEKFLEDFPLSDWILLHNCSEQYKTRHYGYGTSLLYILTERNLLHLCQVEVCRSQSINDKGGRYDYPIIAAAVVGNEQILELLFRYGADHTKSSNKYGHVLHAAVDKLHAPAVAMLLAYGAIPAALHTVPEDFVCKATRQSETAIMKLLLENPTLLRWSIFDETLWYLNPISIAINGWDQSMLGLFFEFGVVSRDNSQRFARAFKRALDYGNEALVLMFIERGADINMVWSHGTALRAASSHGYQAVVRLLIEEGADVNAVPDSPDGVRTTALYSASAKGQHAIVSILLQHGADVNKACPLYAASLSGHEAVVRLLIEAGADVNALHDTSSDGAGITALYGASANQHTIVSILLEHGADVNKACPLYPASSFGHETITRTLLEHGADPNQCRTSTSSGMTFLPLHEALERGHIEIVRLLLDYGADVNTSSSTYADAFKALEVCPYPERCAAIEQLLCERNIVRPHAPYLTWVDGIAYLNPTYNE
ncbi:purine and uridine phosphorylase, partial [Aureobasidium melanogenum]